MRTTTKKTYSKPALSKVKLAPEEAVLTGCKTTTGVRGQGVGMSCTGSCNKANGT